MDILTKRQPFPIRLLLVFTAGFITLMLLQLYGGDFGQRSNLPLPNAALINEEWVLVHATDNIGRDVPILTHAAEDEARRVSIVLTDSQMDTREASDYYFSGFAGCNKIFGNYYGDQQALMISSVDQTVQGCSAEVMAFENFFVSAFDNADTYELVGDLLIIETGLSETLTFRKK